MTGLYTLVSRLLISSLDYFESRSKAAHLIIKVDGTYQPNEVFKTAGVLEKSKTDAIEYRILILNVTQGNAIVDTSNAGSGLITIRTYVNAQQIVEIIPIKQLLAIHDKHNPVDFIDFSHITKRIPDRPRIPVAKPNLRVVN